VSNRPLCNGYQGFFPREESDRSVKLTTHLHLVMGQLHRLRGWTGRAIAQAVSRWLPTASARVWQVGFVVDKVASGQVFSEYFGFPCQNNSFQQILHPDNHPGQVDPVRTPPPNIQIKKGGSGRPRNWGLIPGKSKIFFSSSPLQDLPRSPTTSHPMVPGVHSPRGKRPGREADHSPPSSTEVKNGGAIPQLSNMTS
jgi:hypothetical protein